MKKSGNDVWWFTKSFGVWSFQHQEYNRVLSGKGHHKLLLLFFGVLFILIYLIGTTLSQLIDQAANRRSNKIWRNCLTHRYLVSHSQRAFAASFFFCTHFFWSLTSLIMAFVLLQQWRNQSHSGKCSKWTKWEFKASSRGLMLAIFSHGNVLGVSHGPLGLRRLHQLLKHFGITLNTLPLVIIIKWS